MFWKKKKEKKENKRIILGMVMLSDENSFRFNDFVQDYNANYRHKIDEPTGDNSTAVFKVEDETIGIASMPVPIPSGDIEETAAYAYNWPTAVSDTLSHKGHLIVSLIGDGQDQIKRFKIFTEVICSLLRTTSALGIDLGIQSLIIPKEDYLNEARLMSDESLPLNLWIYIGLRSGDSGNSGYTYGLSAFGKTEMEILNSQRSLEDIRAFLFNIAHYVLEYNVEFRDGQTCGLSQEERIPITFSKGKFVDGETFKLAY